MKDAENVIHEEPKVVTARASDIAHVKLQEMILDLRLAPGVVVNEQTLAAELGLGRMPVREALARLANDRFITVVPRRGAVVTPLALEDVLDIFEAREAIWCGVAYIAASRVTAEDLTNLRALVATANASRGATDAQKFLLDDFAIHTYVVRMVRNPLLQDAADVLLRHSIRFWRLYWKNRPADNETMFSHEALLDALERRDSAASEEAMREHLKASRLLIRNLF